MLDDRRKAGVLAGSGAALAATSTVLGRGHAGLSGDFWRGVPIGVAIVMIVAALVLLARSRRASPPA